MELFCFKCKDIYSYSPSRGHDWSQPLYCYRCIGSCGRPLSASYLRIENDVQNLLENFFGIINLIKSFHQVDQELTSIEKNHSIDIYNSNDNCWPSLKLTQLLWSYSSYCRHRKIFFVMLMLENVFPAHFHAHLTLQSSNESTLTFLRSLSQRIKF